MRCALLATPCPPGMTHTLSHLPGTIRWRLGSRFVGALVPLLPWCTPARLDSFPHSFGNTFSRLKCASTEQKPCLRKVQITHSLDRQRRSACCFGGSTRTRNRRERSHDPTQARVARPDHHYCACPGAARNERRRRRSRRANIPVQRLWHRRHCSLQRGQSGLHLNICQAQWRRSQPQMERGRRQPSRRANHCESRPESCSGPASCIGAELRQHLRAQSGMGNHRLSVHPGIQRTRRAHRALVPDGDRLAQGGLRDSLGPAAV
jgi:hypothetical protein